MKHFLITYTRTNGSEEAWHRDIAAFISDLEGDPDLKGKIVYRCMKVRDDTSYYHLAAAADEQAIKALQQREFFKRYTEKTRQRWKALTIQTSNLAGGQSSSSVSVSPSRRSSKSRYSAWRTSAFGPLQ